MDTERSDIFYLGQNFSYTEALDKLVTSSLKANGWKCVKGIPPKSDKNFTLETVLKFTKGDNDIFMAIGRLQNGDYGIAIDGNENRGYNLAVNGINTFAKKYKGKNRSNFMLAMWQGLTKEMHKADLTTDKKYGFTGCTKEKDGHILHEICLLESVYGRTGIIPKGTVGGWIESEDNLSQHGSCWLYKDSMAFGEGRVTEGAFLICYSTVAGGIVKGESYLHGSLVKDNAVIDVTDSYNSVFFGNCQVSCKHCNGSVVKDDAVILGGNIDSSFISGSTSIEDCNVINSRIDGTMKIKGKFVRYEDVNDENYVKNDKLKYIEAVREDCATAVELSGNSELQQMLSFKPEYNERTEDLIDIIEECSNYTYGGNATVPLKLAIDGIRITDKDLFATFDAYEDNAVRQKENAEWLVKRLNRIPYDKNHCVANGWKYNDVVTAKNTVMGEGEIHASLYPTKIPGMFVRTTFDSYSYYTDVVFVDATKLETDPAKRNVVDMRQDLSEMKKPKDLSLPDTNGKTAELKK